MAIQNVKSHAHVMCFVHGQRIPRAAAHEHHEAPRAAGGTDDVENLVWLCATCHQLSHRVAQLRQLGRGAEAEDIAQTSFGTPAARNRFSQVVLEIMAAHALADDLGLGKAKAEVVLELDHPLYNFLKTLANDHRDNGRKVGVARYIEAVLQKHAIKHGFSSEPKAARVVPKVNPKLLR